MQRDNQQAMHSSSGTMKKIFTFFVLNAIQIGPSAQYH